MTTTSKLGADMTDDLLYKLWALALDTTESEFKQKAPALLARQPAAIDRQEERVEAIPTPSDEARDAARYRWLVKNCFDWAAPGDGDSFDHIELHFEHEFLNRDDASVGTAIDAEIYADLLANEASKPAAIPESPKETMERLTRQFNQMSELERAVIGDFIKPAAPSVAAESKGHEAFERATAVTDPVMADFLSAVAASRANPAPSIVQYRNEALSALLVDHSHAASAKDVDAVLKARDAIYSMFANVAQGAEAVAWPYEITRGHIECLIRDHQRDGQKQLKHGLNSSGSYLIRVAESFRWCLEQMAAAPPAQTALTDDARDAIRRAALDEACAAIKAEDDRQHGNDYMLDSDDCIRVIRELTAAQAETPQ